jgi:hypothetical protein
MVEKYPASTEKVYKPKDLKKSKLITEKHQNIHPTER